MRTVTVASGQGDVERVVVTEDSANSATLTGRIKLKADQANASGDKTLQYKSGTTIRISHGFGYLGRHSTLKP